MKTPVFNFAAYNNSVALSNKKKVWILMIPLCLSQALSLNGFSGRYCSGNRRAAFRERTSDFLYEHRGKIFAFLALGGGGFTAAYFLSEELRSKMHSEEVQGRFKLDEHFDGHELNIENGPSFKPGAVAMTSNWGRGFLSGSLRVHGGEGQEPVKLPLSRSEVSSWSEFEKLGKYNYGNLRMIGNRRKLLENSYEKHESVSCTYTEMEWVPVTETNPDGSISSSLELRPVTKYGTQMADVLYETFRNHYDIEFKDADSNDHLGRFNGEGEYYTERTILKRYGVCS